MVAYLNVRRRRGCLCLAALLALWLSGCGGGEIMPLDRLAEPGGEPKAKPKPQPTLEDRLRVLGPEETLAVLKQGGVRVILDESLPDKPVVGLNFEVATFSDRMISYLERFPNLEVLLLNNKPVTDTGVEHIAKLTALKRLSLLGCRVTNEGLAHLASLASLTDLDLGRNQGVSDEGLPYLTGLPLTKLNLGGTAVSDAGAEHLKQIAGLEILDLDRTKITDQGLVHLAGLAGLGTLKLRRTKVTDEGLAHLTALEQLKSLDVQDTEVSNAGVQALRREIPGLQVSY